MRYHLREKKFIFFRRMLNFIEEKSNNEEIEYVLL